MRFLTYSAFLVGFSCVCFGGNVLDIQGEVQVGANYLDFGKSLTGGPFTPAPGDGAFQVTSVSPESIFASNGVTANELGQIQSLDATGSLTLPSAFITFGPSENLPLTATSIPTGAVGPFDLTDTSQGALATFEVLGYIGSNPAQNPFTAEFSIGFPGVPVTNLFGRVVNEHFCAVLATSGSPTACDPFASSPTTTPEPSYGWAVGMLFAAAAAGEVWRRAATTRAVR